MAVSAIIQNFTDWLPRYPDPFGYLANAAYISGIDADWSGITSAMDSYYAYGYSIAISLLFLLFSNFLPLSKGIIILNIIFFICIYHILIRISFRLLNPVNQTINYFICFVICLYPALLSRISLVIPEIFLTFLTAVCILIFVKLEESPKVIHCICLGIILPYMISVHGRCVGMWLVGCMVMLLMFFKKKIKLQHCIVFFVITCFGIFLYKYFDEYIKDSVYLLGERETQQIKNSFADTIQTIRKIFSPTGLLSFSSTIFAQLFYLGCTTFSFYFLGYQFEIKKLFKYYRKKETDKMKIQATHNGKYIFTELFIFLSSLTIIGLSAALFHKPRRMDHLLYGRHNEMFLPFIVLFGIAYLLNEKESEKVFIKLCWSEAVLLVSTYITYFALKYTEFQGSIPRTIPALELFYNSLMENPGIVFFINFLVVAILLIYILFIKKISLLVAGIFLLVIIGGTNILTTYHAVLREKNENEFYRAPYWELAEFPSFDGMSIYAVKDSSSNAYLVQLLFNDICVSYISEDEILLKIQKAGDCGIIYSERELNNSNFPH